MTNYHQISHNASDIKTALNKLVTPDTQPAQSNNAITSGAIKSYVDVSTSTNSLNLSEFNNAQSIPLSSTRGFHYFSMPSGVNEISEIRQNQTGYPMYVAAGGLGMHACDRGLIVSRPIGSSSDLDFSDTFSLGQYATPDDRVLHARQDFDLVTFRHNKFHYPDHGMFVSGIIPNGREYYINIDTNSASGYYSDLFHYEFLLQ